MQRYYFHLVTPAGTILDDDGRALPGIPEARQEALSIARALIRANGLDYAGGKPSRLVVEDSACTIVATLDCGALRDPLANPASRARARLHSRA